MTSTKEERQANTRNYCNACGYESVALVPIEARGVRIGLIQVVDKRIGMFTISIIEFLEMIGEQVGLAVHNSLIHSKLKEAYDEIKTLRGFIPICANCKKIRNDEEYWEAVEVYISKHSEAEFSHGLCPDCMQALYPDSYEKSVQRRQDILDVLSKRGQANLKTIATEVGLPESNTLNRLGTMISDGKIERLEVKGQTFYKLA